MLNSMKQFILLLRPRQWSKNLFIFFPLFFSMQIDSTDLLINTSAAFLIFCFISSAVYIFNDWHDIKEDKLHPQKKLRPLVTKTVSKRSACTTMVCFSVTGLFLSYLLTVSMLYLVILYMFLNVAYSIKLKHIPIVDVIIIASGFVIRVFIGGVVTHIRISPWIVIMTFLLALLLSLAKRRDDVFIFSDSNTKTRKPINGYNLHYLDMSMMTIAATIIVAYIMYTISSEVMDRLQTDKLYFTALFVLLGIMRFMQITFVENKSGDPTRIFLEDRFLRYVIICWIISFAILIYL